MEVIINKASCHSLHNNIIALTEFKAGKQAIGAVLISCSTGNNNNSSNSCFPTVNKNIHLSEFSSSFDFVGNNNHMITFTGYALHYYYQKEHER